MKAIIFIILLSIISGVCNKEKDFSEVLIHLKEINNRKISIVDTSGWDYFRIDKTKEYISYELMNYGQDTSKGLSFRYWQNQNRYDVWLNNTTICDTVQNLIYHIDIEEDTVFYYTTKELNSLEKTFIIGKYLNDYRYGGMTKGQKCYFKMHKDSLMKIRGNDLPPLPEMECN